MSLRLLGFCSKAKGTLGTHLCLHLEFTAQEMFLGRKLPLRDDFDVIFSPFKLQVSKGNCLKALGVFRALLALEKGVYGPRAYPWP